MVSKHLRLALWIHGVNNMETRDLTQLTWNDIPSGLTIVSKDRWYIKKNPKSHFCFNLKSGPSFYTNGGMAGEGKIVGREWTLVSTIPWEYME